jgi:hypothetical protein
MDAPTLQRWLDEYVEAWRTYDSQKIGDLFSADAVYRFDPIEKEWFAISTYAVSLGVFLRPFTLKTNRA